MGKFTWGGGSDRGNSKLEDCGFQASLRVLTDMLLTYVLPSTEHMQPNDEPMKTRFVPKIHKNRSTAGNRNYKDWGGPPNQFSHRRARNLLLSIIACLCARDTNPTAPGWGRGISGGRAAGFQLVELGGALAGVLDHSAGK